MIRGRAAFVAVAAGLALLSTPGTAAADVVFDPADAQDLADTLAEATQAQGVCYGWRVSIDDQYAYVDSGESVGSNLGVGTPPGAGAQCQRTVEFTANITYTSDSSESDDYASWSVTSTPRGPTTEDLDALELFDEDDLIGDAPDVAVDKAVNALPQLTADAGAARPIEATQERQQPANAGQLTDDPGNDFLRSSGLVLLFAVIMIIGSVVFMVFVLRSSKRQPAAPVRYRGGEPPVNQWAAQQREPGQPQDTLTYPPPHGWDAQEPRNEPPTEPIRQQDGAESTSDDQPERTQKFDPGQPPGDTRDR